MKKYYLVTKSRQFSLTGVDRRNFYAGCLVTRGNAKGRIIADFLISGYPRNETLDDLARKVLQECPFNEGDVVETLSQVREGKRISQFIDPSTQYPITMNIDSDDKMGTYTPEQFKQLITIR